MSRGFNISRVSACQSAKVPRRYSLQKTRSLQESHSSALKFRNRTNNSRTCARRNFSSFNLYDSLSETYKSLPLPGPLTLSEELKGIANSENSSKGCLGIAWYTCGPTVYDSAHLGHAKTYVTLDIIHRALLYQHKIRSQLSSKPETSNHAQNQTHDIQPAPIFIMNITDVDDKIINRAKEMNISPLELARKFELEFWEDMDALNVMRPTVITRVTEHVESSIIPYIEQIEENGMAYVIDDDGVYFDVRAFEDAKGGLNRYGKLASLKSENGDGERDTIFALENPHVKSNTKFSLKKDPRDFVLWKGREDIDTQNDRKELCWESPWGKGRPGWHIECSAMIESTMRNFDKHQIHVHAGGIDLKFPHHTNEIAQAEAYAYPNNDEWIPHWVHTGHLHINGLKMSKSLKNFITIREILGKTGEEVNINDEKVSKCFNAPADDFRLWCLGLSGSYRGPATFSRSRLLEAKRRREKLLHFLIDGEQWLRPSKSCESSYSTVWSRSDHNLVQAASECQVSCVRALSGLSSSSTKNGFDFDGSAFLTSVNGLAEAGRRHVAECPAGEHPTYPVVHALNVLRECLSLVGFSDDTVRAGISENLGGNMIDSHGLVGHLVEFRSTVRNIAIESLEQTKLSEVDEKTSLPIELLKLCDNLRNKILPAVGVEVFDRNNSSPSWRFGVPITHDQETKNQVAREKEAAKRSPPVDVTKSNFFQIDRYEGQFLKFDLDGIPTHNADGSEISKRMVKKLIKKRDAFFIKKSK